MEKYSQQPQQWERHVLLDGNKECIIAEALFNLLECTIRRERKKWYMMMMMKQVMDTRGFYLQRKNNF